MLNNDTVFRSAVNLSLFICSLSSYPTLHLCLDNRSLSHLVSRLHSRCSNPSICAVCCIPPLNVKETDQFWSAYHSVSSISTRVPSILTDGVNSATTSIAWVSLFKLQFASHFTPSQPAQVTSISTVHGVPSLSSIQCCGSDVMVILTRLWAMTACGPDGVTSIVLKKCMCTCSLTGVFNSSGFQ